MAHWVKYPRLMGHLFIWNSSGDDHLPNRSTAGRGAAFIISIITACGHQAPVFRLDGTIRMARLRVDIGSWFVILRNNHASSRCCKESRQFVLNSKHGQLRLRRWVGVYRVSTGERRDRSLDVSHLYRAVP